VKLPPPELLSAARWRSELPREPVPPLQFDLAAEGSARRRGFATNCRRLLDRGLASAGTSTPRVPAHAFFLMGDNLSVPETHPRRVWGIAAERVAS
jgi:hypothetical protein